MEIQEIREALSGFRGKFGLSTFAELNIADLADLLVRLNEMERVIIHRIEVSLDERGEHTTEVFVEPGVTAKEVGSGVSVEPDGEAAPAHVKVEGSLVFEPLASAVPGIVGTASQGPVGESVRVESWEECVRIFGEPTEDPASASAVVRNFFRNGGGRACLVSRMIDGDVENEATRRLVERTVSVELLEPGSVELVGSGSVKALATVRVGDMEVRGFRIIDLGDDELLVASPKFEIVLDGQEEHWTVVRFADTELSIEFNDWVLRCYREKLAIALEAGELAKVVVHKVKSTPISWELSEGIEDAFPGVITKKPATQAPHPGLRCLQCGLGVSLGEMTDHLKNCTEDKDLRLCPACNGTGREYWKDLGLDGAETPKYGPCIRCGGAGTVPEKEKP